MCRAHCSRLLSLGGWAHRQPLDQHGCRNLWAQKMFFKPHCGVWGAPGWWKGYMGQGCWRQWLLSLPEVAASSLHRHPGHSFERPNRCLVPLSPRSDGWQSKCGVLAWSCLLEMMGDRESVGCRSGHVYQEWWMIEQMWGAGVSLVQLGAAWLWR